MNMNLPQLIIICPCYNEEVILNTSVQMITNQMNSLVEQNLISDSSLLKIVDDGSIDKTWDIITKLSKENHRVSAIRLSRNFGHQNAILSGLLDSEDADILVTLDLDLQDDISKLPLFIEQYNQGNDIVYGVRKNRSVEGVFKVATAYFFYSLLKLLGITIIEGHSEFRLISNKVLDSLKEYKEVNLFLRGIFPSIGFNYSIVEYDVSKISSRTSRYTLSKMFGLAINGITSFTSVPLRLITIAAFVAFIQVCLLAGWALWQKINGITVAGWSSTIISIYFLGAVQLFSLAVIAEYVGKIYQEVKKRPRFIINERV